MTLPKYDALMLPTLRALVKLGGSASINEIQDQLTEQLKFSPEEVEASYPKGGAAILPIECLGPEAISRLAAS